MGRPALGTLLNCRCVALLYCCNTMQLMAFVFKAVKQSHIVRAKNIFRINAAYPTFTPQFEKKYASISQ